MNRDTDAIPLVWRTSSYSSGGNNCVEVATLPSHGMTAVRDSKISDGPIQAFSHTAWTALVSGLTSRP